MAQGNINTSATVGSRTREALYSGNYVSPGIQDALNKTYKKHDLVVEFLSNGSGSFVMPILSLGVAATEKTCKGTCGVNNGCCNGYLETYVIGGGGFERTGGIAAGSLKMTFEYNKAAFPTGIKKVAFFVAALSEKGYQIVAKFVSSADGQIVYTLEAYNEAGVLSDEPFIGATINMSFFINDAYSA